MGGVGVWVKQVKLVLWKNYLLKTRSWKSLTVEILMPTLIFLLLVIIRQQVPIEHEEASTTAPMAFPSSGVVVFFQSLFCNGLYDLPPDLGYPITSPSIIRQIGSGIDGSRADVSMAAGTITKILFHSLNTSVTLPDCTNTMIDTVYEGFPMTLENAIASSECYCDIAATVDVVATTKDIVERMMKKFITFPNTTEVERFLKKEFDVSITDEEVDNLDNLFVAMFPLFTQEPTSSMFKELLSGNISDVSDFTSKLFCPTLPPTPKGDDPQLNIPDEFRQESSNYFTKFQKVFGGSKIFYAPKNKKTDMLVKQMNRTFEALSVAFNTLKCSALAGKGGKREVSSFDPGMIIERWLHIDGTAVRGLLNDPRYPHNPDMRFIHSLDSLSFISNIGDDFGQQLRGYFRAPATGNYTFWVAGDDQTVLNISRSAYPHDNEELACYVWWSKQEHNWYFRKSAQSEPIFLEKGKYYSLSLTNKEHGGYDYGSVTVKVPSTCTDATIPICSDPRFKEDPITGEGEMPLDGVMFLPSPLYVDVHNNSKGNVVEKKITVARLFTDIGAMAMLETGDPFVGYEDVNKMVEDSMPARKASVVVGGIQFLNMDMDENEDVSDNGDDGSGVHLPEHLQYSIRLNPAKTPSTRQQVRKITTNYGSWTWFLYYYSGFSFVQDMVDRAFINLQMGYDTTTEIPTMAQQFPTPKYVSDDFARALGPVLPLFMTVSMVYIVSMTVKSIVYEKELKLKESMKLMGISSGVHWAAWFITCVLVTLPSMSIITVLLFVGRILQNSDPILVFLLLEAFVISSIFLSFLISAFFSQAKIAAACAGLIFCGFYVPFVFIILHINELTRGEKLGSSLMSTTSFGMATQYIADMEQTGYGLQWSNLFSGYGPCDNFSAGSAVVMVLIDGILYMLLTLYFEAILPGDYGVPKHPLFFLSPLKSLFSVFRLSLTSDYVALSQATTAQLVPDESILENDDHLSSSEAEGVVIDHLIKDYHHNEHCSTFCLKSHKKKPLAVNGLSLRIPARQVTSLLGSNGAGKSTTISILCGLIPATSGNITICGKPLKPNSVQNVRQHLGMCPQHNTLFDNLTVQEHITFASSIKKLAFEKKEALVSADSLLQCLGLSEYKDVQSKNLSGGNKRKLSVALAFLETPEIVILDEPTAGMDPSARRATWNLILLLRKSCAVVLTTHHLDEADLLSDNVAIMKRGTLRAFGTPLELKDQKGRGYTLTFSLNADGSDSNGITALVKDHIQGVATDHSSPSEISFVLPSNSVHLFPTMFESIEQEKDALGIDTFGVSASKLEDVFLHVTKDGEKDVLSSEEFADIFEELQQLSSSNTEFGTTSTSSAMPLRTLNVQEEDDGPSSTFVHMPPSNALSPKKLAGHWWDAFKIQLAKRWWYTLRDIKTLFSMIILPVIFLSFAMFVAQYTSTLHNEPKMELGVNTYKDACYGTEFYTPVYSYDPGFTSTQLNATLNCPSTLEECPFVTSFVDLEHTAEFVNCYDAEAGHRQPDTHKHGTGDGFCYKRNVSNYLVRNSHEFMGKYHGSVTVGRQQDAVMTGAGFGTHTPSGHAEDNSGVYVRGWFEPLDVHSLPAFTNLANNVALKRLTNNPNAHITTYNHPLNTSLDTSLQEYIESGTSVSVAIFIIFALSFVPASVLVFLVLERVGKSKHLQLAAGCPRWVYWIASLMWDYASYIFTAALCLVVLVCFDLDGYAGRNLGVIMALIILYGLACVPLMYPVSFLFGVPATAYVNMVVINMFVGITTTLITFVLDTLSFQGSLLHTNEILKKVFLVFPNYCLGRGILDVVKSEFETEYLEVLAVLYDEQKPTFPSPFGWDIAGRPLAFLAFQAMLFPLCTLVIEYRQDISEAFKRLVSFYSKNTAASNKMKKKKKGGVVSPETLQELRSEISEALLPIEKVRDSASLKRERVEVFEHPERFALKVRGLTKIYKKGRLHKKATMAVDRVSFGMRQGECFGLLGVNGAGKSTTFKTITGEHSPSYGDILVGDVSVKRNKMVAQQSTGYCPQFDALLPRLTPVEHLNMFGVFRNLQSSSRARVVELLVSLLGLEGWKDTPANQLSGGNKRKLSLGLALIGNRNVILLDEPSAGMDAHAKRFLWSRVVNVVERGCSVLLTSHSMEECEALCTRVAIMVKGRLHCIGTPQFIKSKYGDGYTLVLKCDAAAVEQVEAAVFKAFEGTTLVESHRGYCRFIVPTAASLPLSSTFTILLKLKEQYPIEHFTFSQTSLEDVFLKFSSPELEDEDRGKIKVAGSNTAKALRGKKYKAKRTPKARGGYRRLDSYTLEIDHDTVISSDEDAGDTDDEGNSVWMEHQQEETASMFQKDILQEHRSEDYEDDEEEDDDELLLVDGIRMGVMTRHENGMFLPPSKEEDV